MKKIATVGVVSAAMFGFGAGPALATGHDRHHEKELEIVAQCLQNQENGPAVINVGLILNLLSQCTADND
ncbi:hypothetical protein [Marinitenerispora sediminis]|nr:hypothetical protein [Marinitenerispora sediminis]